MCTSEIYRLGRRPGWKKIKNIQTLMESDNCVLGRDRWDQSLLSAENFGGLGGGKAGGKPEKSFEEIQSGFYWGAPSALKTKRVAGRADSEVKSLGQGIPPPIPPLPNPPHKENCRGNMASIPVLSD